MALEVLTRSGIIQAIQPQKMVKGLKFWNIYGFRKELYCLCRETKVLISCEVTTQLICAFVFAFAYSHDAAQFTSL